MKYFNGEYKSVQDASMNHSRLRAAHQTPCDASTAYFLIAVCHDRIFGKDHPAPLVKLRKPHAGKQRARGWGGRKVATKVVNGVETFSHYRGYVSLPITELPVSMIDNPFGYLRIGLVLHEYAHAVEVLKFGKTDHGARFTLILDSLLQDTQQFWMMERDRIAAESK